MRTIYYILQKEFIQILRNKSMLPILFIMPFIQLIILSNAADYEVKNIKIHLIDNDRSSLSQKYIGKIQASPYFKIVDYSVSSNEGYSSLHAGKADLFVHIPMGFEKDLIQNKGGQIQVTADAVNGVKAGVSVSYINNLTAGFNMEYIKNLKKPSGIVQAPQIKITYANWYNPELDYKAFMVPGILVMLVTMIGAFLSAMNIVREKEIGTIEQLNVTPIKKHYFIIGKLTPFWIMGLIILTVGLIVGKLLFDIPILGSIGLVYAFSGIYLLVILGLGFFVSTMTETQQQALFLSWFLLVIFILMSGLFTPVESMPYWAQVMAKANPIAWFVEFNRLVFLKGSHFLDVKTYFVWISVAAVVMNLFAILNYRKRV